MEIKKKLPEISRATSRAGLYFLVLLSLGLSDIKRVYSQEKTNPVSSEIMHKFDLSSESVLAFYEGDRDTIHIPEKDIYPVICFYAKVCDYQGEFVYTITRAKGGYICRRLPFYRTEKGADFYYDSEKSDIIAHNHPISTNAGSYKYKNGKWVLDTSLLSHLGISRKTAYNDYRDGLWMMTSEEYEFYSAYIQTPFSPKDLLSLVARTSENTGRYIVSGPVGMWVMSIQDREEFFSDGYGERVEQWGKYLKWIIKKSINEFLREYDVDADAFSASFVHSSLIEEVEDKFNQIFNGADIRFTSLQGHTENFLTQN